MGKCSKPPTSSGGSMVNLWLICGFMVDIDGSSGKHRQELVVESYRM